MKLLQGAALGIVDHLRRRFARLELGAHLLECGSENFDLRLLARVSRYKPSDGRFLFLVPAMLFEKLIKQHRVHSFVAHRLRFAIPVRGYKVWIDLGHFLGDQAKRDASASDQCPSCSEKSSA